MDMKKYVGRRILIAMGRSNEPEIREVKVKEVSRSGRFVRLLDLDGQTVWKEADCLRVVEILPEQEEASLGRLEGKGNLREFL